MIFFALAGRRFISSWTSRKDGRREHEKVIGQNEAAHPDKAYKGDRSLIKAAARGRCGQVSSVEFPTRRLGHRALNRSNAFTQLGCTHVAAIWQSSVYCQLTETGRG